MKNIFKSNWKNILLAIVISVVGFYMVPPVANWVSYLNPGLPQITGCWDESQGFPLIFEIKSFGCGLFAEETYFNVQKLILDIIFWFFIAVLILYLTGIKGTKKSKKSLSSMLR